MVRAASAAIAFLGLCMGVGVALLLPVLPPGLLDGAQAGAQLDPAAHMMLAAVATFFAAVTVIYVHLRNGGAGARRFPEVILLILCGSVGLLDLALCTQAGPVQAPAVLLRVAAVQMLPHAAAATFYLSLVLTYVHVRAATGGAGNEPYPAAVELLKTMTLAATLITGVLSSITAALVFDTK
ncbi:hypothetical protein C2845_PM09G05920 [Panicum miliaceum]|uniref:Uncharacterized protein n=1 Tax=Panicum miliaceum TaxID=4540 RepID=A0A3L6S4J0_PANMI|nr:hypothetical protein C2845_PM09G05920 [Panicum miliaceum]